MDRLPARSITLRTSTNIAGLQPSATVAVAALARELRAQGRDIVDLSAGEPDFDTPAFIRSAAIHAIEHGATRYAAAPGIQPLREAIARDLASRTGRDIDPAGIVVSAGAKQAIFNACFVLFGPGDRVLFPAPYWTSYPDIVRLARAEPVPVAGDPDNGYKVTPALLEAASDDRTRGLILNSPCNPTGAVYTREELEAIYRWAAERDIWIISDEIYARICFTANAAPGLLELPEASLDRVVIVDGASKTFAMTGWRIGFSYSNAELARHMAALQSHITTSAATPSQYAALAAYRAEGEHAAELRAMAETFRRRRDHVVSLFRELLPGTEFVYPEGAFYLFFRVDGFFRDGVNSAVELCRKLIEEGGVALVPGAAFGDDRFVRLSFAASEEMLTEGIRRIARTLSPGSAGGTA
ncbi:MAG: pyridoxal phosphate-dependent aminotransferase [bacterium]|jgi:aspartate/methionine/tyrosine aminotransferase|nr:MAG: hypothetical protein DIU52_09190 [bacterium]